MCPAGTWSDQPGAVRCTNCLRGTYNQNTGSTVVTDCLACLHGQVSTEGAYACTGGADPGCPVGQWSSDGTTACQDCAAGSFSNTTGRAGVCTTLVNAFGEIVFFIYFIKF